MTCFFLSTKTLILPGSGSCLNLGVVFFCWVFKGIKVFSAVSPCYNEVVFKLGLSKKGHPQVSQIRSVVTSSVVFQDYN